MALLNWSCCCCLGQQVRGRVWVAPCYDLCVHGYGTVQASAEKISALNMLVLHRPLRPPAQAPSSSAHARWPSACCLPPT